MSAVAPTGSKRARLLVLPRWHGPDGIRAIMAVATPLILSHAVHALNLFLDRTMLAWFSQDAFTASLQGGILNWTLLVAFLQTVGYAGTFVAQYHGAGESRRIGPAVWQGVYMALVGGLILMALSPIGYPLFRWVGHEEPLPLLEAQYFQILALGAPVFLLCNALSGYYTGLGRTGVVLFVTFAGCMMNAALNLWFIFTPVGPIPSGIQGAGVATVLGAVWSLLLYILFMGADPMAESLHALRSGWRFDSTLFRRILRFGLPSGIHGMIEHSGFMVFMMVVGLFGYAAQQASNMAMNINLVLFIPAVGLHVTASILVGQFCGGRNTDSAERVTSTIFAMCFGYMVLVSLVYILFPATILHLFRGGMPEAEWQSALALARILLIFVAVYSLFDSVALVYSGALKGAGDTKWVMWAGMILSQLSLTLPCIILASQRGGIDPSIGLRFAWGICAFYIFALGTFYLLRFWSGHWKSIEVIDRDLAEVQGDPPAEVLGRPDTGIPA
jgi:MATE family multidrug resistance protein